MQEATATAIPNDSGNYSLDTMVRYAFFYEIQNKLSLNPDLPNDPKLKAALEYMERRVLEITKKYK